MKKILAVTILAAIPLLPITQVKAQNVESNDPRGTISASGNAFEILSPDTAFVSIAVETKAAKVQTATNLNSTQTAKVIDSIKKIINPSLGDSIRTSNFNIQPEYTYNKNTQQNVLTGYRVTNEVTVKTKQLDKIGTIIENSISSGANRVQNIDFSLENTKNACTSIIKTATDKARVQAQTLADSLGVKIVGVRRATSFCEPNRLGPVPMYMKGGVAAETQDARIAVPVEPGEVTVNGNVNIDFIIDNK